MATHDYVIANASGSAVRQDINNALEAIVSNNSNATSPGTTYAYQFWVDTTANQLKIRNSANDAWITLRELDGTILMQDGSASSPSLCFRTDTDTGFYKDGDNRIGITCAGVERATFLDAGVIFNDAGNDCNFRVESSTKSHMLFVDGGEDRVGIGTSSPGTILTAGTGTGTNAITINGKDSSTSVNQLIFHGGGTNNPSAAIEYDCGDAGLAFQVGNHSSLSSSERARIDDTARLLLNTSSPLDSDTSIKFHTISNSGAGIALGRSDDSVTTGDDLGRILFYGNDGGTYQICGLIKCEADGNHSNSDKPSRLVFGTTEDDAGSPSTQMVIDSAGRIGFGGEFGLGGSGRVSINPADGLIGLGMDGREEFVTSTSGAYIYSGSGSSGTTLAGELILQSRSNVDRNIKFVTGSSPAVRMQVGGDGVIKIGAGSTVTPDTNANDLVIDKGAADTGISILSTSTGRIYFGDAADDEAGSIRYVHSDNSMRFETASGERLRIDSSGDVMIGTTSNAASADADNLIVGSTGGTHQGITINGSSSSQIRFADSGSNSAGYIIYSHSANNLQFATNGSEVMRIDSAGSLGLGTTSPSRQFHNANNISLTTGSAPQYRLNGGAGDSNDDDRAIFGLATGTNHFFSGSAAGDTVLRTTNNGNLLFGVGVEEKMRIFSSGQTHHFSTQGVLFAGTSQGAGTTYWLFRGNRSRTSNTSGGTTVFYVWSNGNVQNTNNSYTGISDVKLKENIVDATSQWDDLKALQVRKYNFIEGETHTQIGLIAQEVETVSPGLVNEITDRDEEGNDLGTVTKSVNYSVLYMKAVKALQEAMERIETLEAKVAALEAG